jgi:hypothetical protein
MALLQRIAAARNAAADTAGVKLGQTNSQSNNNSSGVTPAGDQVPQRLKVVLMSATLDANIYSAYYWGCPVLSCPGRTFPVTVRYLEDCYAETRYALRCWRDGDELGISDACMQGQRAVDAADCALLCWMLVGVAVLRCKHVIASL